MKIRKKVMGTALACVMAFHCMPVVMAVENDQSGTVDGVNLGFDNYEIVYTDTNSVLTGTEVTFSNYTARARAVMDICSEAGRAEGNDVTGAGVVVYGESAPVSPLNRSDAENPVSSAQGAGGFEFIDPSTCSEYDAVVVELDDMTYQLETPDGKVLGVLHKVDSEDALIPSSTYGVWSINWPIGPNQIARGNNVFSSYDGFTFTFNITVSPETSSKVGVYLHDDGSLFWFDEGGTGTSIRGYWTFAENAGYVSFAIKNTSDHSATYTGSYSDD